jgi:hypothetical protein
MDQQTFTLGCLLEQAGFRIRGRGRADCVHCEGGSSGTVSFTDEVCFCHRCHWKSNVRLLARELGLLSEDPEARQRFAEQERQRQERESVIKKFEEWRDTCQRVLTHRFRELSHKAENAKVFLVTDPNCEVLWSALANFFHEEAELSAALDQLSFEKVSPWLDWPMTREKLTAAVHDANARLEGNADAVA